MLRRGKISIRLLLIIFAITSLTFTGGQFNIKPAVAANPAGASPCLQPSTSTSSTQTVSPSTVKVKVPGHRVPVTMQLGSLLSTLSPLPSNVQLHLTLTFQIQNLNAFQACLQAIHDPNSPYYHQFLNLNTLQPYLPPPGVRASIISWLEAGGFTVNNGTSPLTLQLSADTVTVQNLFGGLTLNTYKYNGTKFYGPSDDPQVPQNYASYITAIVGLDNSTIVRPGETPCGPYPSTPYCPQAIQNGYSITSLYGSYNGAGVNVAIVDMPGDPNIQQALTTYDTQYTLATPTLTIYYPDGPVSSWNAGWASETAMDVEAVHTVAPGANIILIYDTTDTMNGVDYVATNKLANIVSNSWGYECSYGPCSDTELPSSLVSNVDSRLAVDAAQGLTILFASGDSGAAPDGVNLGTMFPASDPNVLAVGATNLQLSGCGQTSCTSYSGETGAVISGGGYSGHFAEPSWQQAAIGSKSGRAVPDVSMLGYSPDFWVYSTLSNKCVTVTTAVAGWFGCAGTSLSTPLWAGFLAIVLQMRSGVIFGNIGPLIYQVATGGSYSTIFHDITSGGNNGYSAITGWDPVTGWGSPIANTLAPALLNSIFFDTTPSSYPSGTSAATITACGGSYSNGKSSTSCGSSFTATANLPSPSTGWQFYQWAWSSGLSCSSSTANPVTCTVTGTGSLTAVYSAQVTFATYPSSTALIYWGSCGGSGYGNGQSLFSANYGSVAVCYLPTGYTPSSWTCSGGLSCSGSGFFTTVSFTGLGTVTLNLKTGSLSNPVSTSLTASASPSSLSGGASFSVSGTLTAAGIGVGGEQIVIVFGWGSSMVTVTTAADGSYSYTTTAPASSGSYDVRVFFLGDYGTSTQYLPSMATAMITVT